MATNNGKERRRRIIDTGSDRLALIKGRIHDLPSSPSLLSRSPRHSSFKESPRSSFFSSENQDQTPQTPVSSDQSNNNEKDKETDGMSSKMKERRRRIVERGSDRLALITGRLQDLPSSPSSLSSPHYNAFKEPLRSKSFSHVHDNTQMRTLLNETSTAGSQSSGNAFNLSLLKQLDAKTSTDAPKSNLSDIPDQIKESDEPQKNDNTNEEPIRTPTPDENLKTTQPTQTKIHRPNLFSSKRINSCIISSEKTRSLCALIIALWVVLSYRDDPSNGKNLMNFGSVLASRPLYSVLLTDVAIVLGQAYLRNRGESFEESDNNERVASSEDGENWRQAIKLMERGLVVYQSIRAIFIDFSIYTVVLICGLFLV